MLNNTGDQHLKNLSLSPQVSSTQKQLLVQKYLQSPFSVSWSKLAALFQQADQALNQPEVTEKDQFEQHESDSIRKELARPLIKSVGNADLCMYWINVVNADMNLIDERETLRSEGVQKRSQLARKTVLIGGCREKHYQ